MKVSVITPTGDRSNLLGRLNTYMSRQTRQPDEWIVCDDGAEAPPVKLDATTYIKPSWIRGEFGTSTLPANLLEAMNYVTGDLILIMEDDDWYDKDYIQTYVELAELYPESLLFGCANNVYYRWPEGLFLGHNNKQHSSLCSTGFKSGATDQFIQSCINPWMKYYVDGGLWYNYGKKLDRTMFIHEKPIVIGMKNLTSDPVGFGHGRHDNLFLEDTGNVLLKKWIGEEDTAWYRNFVTNRYGYVYTV